MSDTDETPPSARSRPRRWFSWIWIAPLLAVGIVIWLAIRALAERGPMITISFGDAEGIQAGDTKIRHKDVDLGTVESIYLSRDMSRVFVRARMRRSVTPHLDRTPAGWNRWYLGTVHPGCRLVYRNVPGQRQATALLRRARRAGGSHPKHAGTLVYASHRRSGVTDRRLADLLPRRPGRRGRGLSARRLRQADQHLRLHSRTLRAVRDIADPVLEFRRYRCGGRRPGAAVSRLILATADIGGRFLRYARCSAQYNRK